eukprot:325520-Alexandrium_andersonii.AAC.1
MSQPDLSETGATPPSSSTSMSGPSTAPVPSLDPDPGAESARRLGAQPKASPVARDAMAAQPGAPA